MKFSLHSLSLTTSLIKKFFQQPFGELNKQISDIPSSKIEDFCNILCEKGFEVDEYYKTQLKIKDIYVGKVISVENHPSLKKVRICSVESNGVFQVLCGAEIINTNSLYAFAKPGSQVGNLIIQKRVIANITSEGMLCSGEELGFSKDNNLFEVNEEEYKEGDLLEKNMFSFNDIMLNISILPNRNDCLSWEGMAREIHCILGGEVNNEGVLSYKEGDKINIEKNFLQKYLNEVKKKNIIFTKNNINVINESNDCTKFLYSTIQNPQKISPVFIRQIINTTGYNLINGIVDICNFFMYFSGQPLHSYNLNKITNNKIIIANNSHEEEFIGLKFNKIIIPNESIITKDENNNILSLVGIIGGNDSKVMEDSDYIFIESAIINKNNIIKTVEKLNIITDASFRFSRGLMEKECYGSIDYTLKFLSKCDSVISQINNACVYIEQTNSTLFLSQSKWFQYTNIPLSSQRQIELIAKNGFIGKVILKDRKDSVNKEIGILVDIPYWRISHINIPEALISEIFRLYGMENLQENNITFLTEKTNEKEQVCKQKDSEKWLMESQKLEYKNNFIKKTKILLCNIGFQEIKSMSFCGEKFINTSLVDNIKIINPFSNEQNYLKDNTLSSLVSHQCESISFGSDSCKLFEVSSIFTSSNNTSIEPLKIGMCIYGKQQGINIAIKDNIFYTIESLIFYINEFFQNMNIKIEFLSKKEERDLMLNTNDRGVHLFEEAVVGYLYCKETYLGIFGKIKSDISNNNNIFCCEIDFSVLIEYVSNDNKIFQKDTLLKNSFFLDFSLEIKKEITGGDVEKIALLIDNVKSVNIIDCFSPTETNNTIKDSNKSITIRLYFHICNKITSHLKKEAWEKSSIVFIEKLNAIIR
jgi:phenylalanyl-tRNA synthetase beta chain